MDHSLHKLPVELLYEIQIYSCWNALPITSKRFYSVFKASPLSVRAEYLLARFQDAVRQPGAGHPRLVSKILRYPICTPAVLELVLGLPGCPEVSSGGRIQLPRRLFRDLSSRPSGRWRDTDPPLPMLRYLYSHPRIPAPDPDGWNGYALTKAVAAGFIPLVRFLLDQGASPANKNGLAVHAAIRRKDLALVKLLIEPDPSAPVASSSRTLLHEDGAPPRPSGSKKRRSEGRVSVTHSSKRRRLEDRVAVTQEMLKTAVACDARDIVQYFVQEKSCMPDLHTVRTMPLPR